MNTATQTLILLAEQPLGFGEYNGRDLKEWVLGFLAGGSQSVKLVWTNGARPLWTIETRTRNGDLIDSKASRSPVRALVNAGELLGVKFAWETVS